MAISINSINGNRYVALADPIAADAVVSSGNFVIGNSIAGDLESIPLANMINFTRTPYVLAVKKVQDVTPIIGSNTVYNLSVLDGSGYQHTYSYTSDASGTVAEVTAAFTAMINADTRSKISCVDNTTKITITADAGYNKFTLTGSSVLTVETQATAGVYGVGTGAILAAQGYDDAATGTNYTRYTYTYYLNSVSTVFEVIANEDGVTYGVFNGAATANATAPALVKGTVTQITSITTGVTLDAQVGVITTVALTTAASTVCGAFTVTNRYISTSSVIVASCGYGTATTGAPNVVLVSKANGSCILRLANGKTGTEALDGTVTIHLQIS